MSADELLLDGDGSARFAMAYRAKRGDWEAVPEGPRRVAAMHAMHDAVTAFRAWSRAYRAEVGPWQAASSDQLRAEGRQRFAVAVLAYCDRVL